MEEGGKLLIESTLRGDILDESNVKCRTCGSVVKLNDDVPFEALNWIFHIRACKEPRKLHSDTRLAASSSSFSSTDIPQGEYVKPADRKRKIDMLLADEDAPTAMEQGSVPSSHPFVMDKRVLLQSESGCHNPTTPPMKSRRFRFVKITTLAQRGLNLASQNNNPAGSPSEPYRRTVFRTIMPAQDPKAHIQPRTVELSDRVLERSPPSTSPDCVSQNKSSDLSDQSCTRAPSTSLDLDHPFSQSPRADNDCKENSISDADPAQNSTDDITTHEPVTNGDGMLQTSCDASETCGDLALPVQPDRASIHVSDPGTLLKDADRSCLNGENPQVPPLSVWYPPDPLQQTILPALQHLPPSLRARSIYRPALSVDFANGSWYIGPDIINRPTLPFLPLTAFLRTPVGRTARREKIRSFARKLYFRIALDDQSPYPPSSR